MASRLSPVVVRLQVVTVVAALVTVLLTDSSIVRVAVSVQGLCLLVSLCLNYAAGRAADPDREADR